MFKNILGIADEITIRDYSNPIATPGMAVPVQHAISSVISSANLDSRMKIIIKHANSPFKVKFLIK